ncbi:hypothetical protein C8R46DRAFT_1054692 [Mycena filopes]|nr:hypothetical protein C8R46DRAFT_1054692 [Mycena filopes]
MHARLRPVAARFSVGLDLHQRPCFTTGRLTRHLTTDASQSNEPRKKTWTAHNPLGQRAEELKAKVLEKEEKSATAMALLAATNNASKLSDDFFYTRRQQDIIARALAEAGPGADNAETKMELARLQALEKQISAEWQLAKVAKHRWQRVQRVEEDVKRHRDKAQQADESNRKLGKETQLGQSRPDSTITEAKTELMRLQKWKAHINEEKLRVEREEKYRSRINMEQLIKDMKPKVKPKSKTSKPPETSKTVPAVPGVKPFATAIPPAENLPNQRRPPPVHSLDGLSPLPKTSVTLPLLPPFVTLSDLGRISLHAGASAADVVGFYFWISTAPQQIPKWNLSATIHFRSENSARQFVEKPLLLAVRRPQPASSDSAARQPEVDVFPPADEADVWSPSELQSLHTRTPQWSWHEFNSPPTQSSSPHPIAADEQTSWNKGEKDGLGTVEHEIALTLLWNRLHTPVDALGSSEDSATSEDPQSAHEQQKSAEQGSSVLNIPATSSINGEEPRASGAPSPDENTQTELSTDIGPATSSTHHGGGLDGDVGPEPSPRPKVLKPASSKLRQMLELSETESTMDLETEKKREDVSRVLKLVFGPANDRAPPKESKAGPLNDDVEPGPAFEGHAPPPAEVPPMLVSVQPKQESSHRRGFPPTTTRWLTLRVPGSGVPVLMPGAPNVPISALSEMQAELEHQDPAAAAYARALRKALARERELEEILRRRSAEAQERALQLARMTAEVQLRADFGAWGMLEGVWVRGVRRKPVGEGDDATSMYELHALIGFSDVIVAARAVEVVPVQNPSYAKSGLRFVEMPWPEARNWRHHSVSTTVGSEEAVSEESDGAREGWVRRLEREHRTEALMREREKERERQRGAAEGTWGKERLSEIRERLSGSSRREERKTAYEAHARRTASDSDLESESDSGSSSSSDSDSDSESDSEAERDLK